VRVQIPGTLANGILQLINLQDIKQNLLRMAQFLGFVKKEFLHIFRDPRTILILFIVPIAQILIFGYVVTNEIKDIPIAILDQSKDEVTRELTQKIISSGYFRLEENLTSLKDIDTKFRGGKIKEVIVFGSRFAQTLQIEGKVKVQILADASDPNTADLTVHYTDAIFHDYYSKMMRNKNLPAQIIPQVRMVFNPNLKGVYMFVPGTMALILMLISAMMTSISIAREKELGTMEILMVSPIRPRQVILGKVLPYILLSFTNAIVIIFLGYLVFGLPVKGSIALLLAESFLYILLALSLGILISTISNSQQVAMFISLFALMLPTILLSGFIYPIENMPVVLQWLSNLMPPKWYIIVIKNIMVKGEGLLSIWKETLIMSGMTLFFLMVSIKKFKTRLI